jgi:hypothetical protein
MARESAAQTSEGLRAAAPATESKDASESSVDKPGQAPSAVALPEERMVIKSATLQVRVKDVPSAFARAVQLAETSGGYIQASTQSEEAGERADVTIRVPPHGFLPLIASLEALGSVDSRGISGEDVTQEYYDLTGELQNQMEVRGRLFQLLKQAIKVKDAIDVEEQLERIGANVNRIKGRMKYLETMTGMSTVSLTLYTDARPSSEGFINWSMIGHGFFRAAQILVNALFVVLQVLVVAIPLAVIGGGIAWGIVLLVRYVRRVRAPAQKPAPKSPARKA